MWRASGVGRGVGGRGIVVLIVALVGLVGWSWSPDERSGTYVERLGRDTMAVERFQETEERLEGSVVFRSPVTQIISYAAELDAHGLPVAMRGTVEPLAGVGPAASSFSVRLHGDSAYVVTAPANGDTTRASFEVGPDAMVSPPRFPVPVAVLQAVVDRHRSAGGDSLAVAMVNPLAPAPIPVVVSDAGSDRISLRMAAIRMLVVLEDDGRIERVDATGTTMGIAATREDGVDVDALASRFASRDTRGDTMGIPSPPGEESVRVGPAEVTISYSRPAARGRELWGGLVPFGEVWRLGANAATHLTTTEDLVLGDTRLPAGQYTLWAVHRPDGAELVVNGQTGQWGTQHDPARDLFRVPLQSESLDAPLDRFTIDVKGGREEGVLSYAWGERRFSVSLRVPEGGS